MKRITLTFFSCIVTLSIALFAAVSLATFSIVSLPSSAYAAEKNTDENFLFDYYPLFSDSEYEQLDTELKELSNKYNVGVYLYITKSIGSSSAREYAKQFYSSDPPLGFGNDYSGILFMIAVDSRDYATITHGTANSTFNSGAIEYIENNVVAQLKNNAFKEGSSTYYKCAKSLLDGSVSRSGSNTADIDTNPFKNGKWIHALFVAIIVGLIVALAVCLHWKKQMRTANIRTEAKEYTEAGSFDLTFQDDTFVNSVETRIPKMESNNHGGGFGGPERGGGGSIPGNFGGSRGGKF